MGRGWQVVGASGFVAAAASLFAFVAAPACRKAEPLVPPKHVLLLVIDTQRADHLSCYGNKRPTTPTLDALAKEGIVFENAVSQCSWTLPSMVSMMTSSYLGAELWQIPADKMTLAEAFKSAGWSTAAFICNDLLSPDNHFERGFDVFEYKLTPYSPNDPILEWFQKRKDQNTFTFVHLNEVHDPYHPPDDFTHFRNLPEPLSIERLRYYDDVTQKLGLVEKQASLKEIVTEIGSYDDDVRYCDQRIHGIFEGIKQCGAWNDTAILVGADHGEGLWTRVQYLDGTRLTSQRRGDPRTLVNSLQMTHGSQLNWELVHVPLILKSPGLAPGTRIRGYVENVDILPTLLDLAALKPIAGAQGQSLVPIMRKSSDDDVLDNGAYAYTKFHSAFISPEGMHYIHPTQEGICAFDLKDELYNIKLDPEERNNLAAEKREVVKKLDGLVRTRSTSGIRGPSIATPETLKSIKGLGYFETGEVNIVREELAKTPTTELLDRLLTEHYCLMRMELVRALKERELSEKERGRLNELKAREVSDAVRELMERSLGH